MKYQVKNLLNNQYTPKKEGQEGKIGPAQGWKIVGGERV
jgi:hypothetical protein